MKDLDSIYIAARKLPPEDRAAYLVRVCAGDPELRARAEQMLAVADEAEAFIADPPDVKGEDRKRGGDALFNHPPERAPIPTDVIGQMIGRYRIVERIGEGGYGSVYVAEQTEPVRRRVALKVIKLGMDTKAVVGRFEAERQALALMDHPNIARVLDAGATDQGRPYFVMELVLGIPITDYCDQANLRIRERLALFIKVCQAIQHAHQKGIIHRDIKPSNVLVTLHGDPAAVGVPKVIDFGIAKAIPQLRDRLTDATIFTQLHQFVGTPAYMSPEQADLTGLDIDTRSDIYSLGVLLYRLLSGCTPFDTNELMASGIDGMCKAIREKEPLRPSTKLSQMLLSAQTKRLTIPEGKPATPDEVKADSRRRLQLKETIALLRGDLDWIVMKCLEKDRTRRYETANALAMDIQRHLNTEPIVARPPSRLYEFRMTVRRHKFGFAATTALIAILTTGVLTSTWQAVRATRAERLATGEAARASQQQRFAEENLAKAEEAERTAMEQRIRADREAEDAQQNLYYAQMHLGQQAWREHRGLQNMLLLLDQWLPKDGSPDRRGWEWFYLSSLPYQYVRTLTQGQSNFVELVSRESFCTVAWNRATRRLAEGSPDGLIRIWDVDREQTILILRSPEPALSWPGIEWFTWRPDGGRLAAGGKDGTVHVWETDSGREIQALRGHTSPVISVAYSSDGVRVAAWGADGTIKIWDANSGRLTAEAAHRPNASVGAWSPDGTLLATGYLDGTVTVSGTQAGDEPVTLQAHARSIHRLAWSPDSRRLASTSGDHTAKIWDLASQTMVLGPLRHSHEVTSIAWDQDGQRLATGSTDETIKIWKATTGRENITLRGHVQTVCSLSWGPDGRLASGCRDGSVKIWNPIRNQESKVLLGHVGRATSVAWSPDGKRLASGGDDGMVRLWNPATGEQVQSLRAHDPSRVHQEFGLMRSLAWSPDGSRLASAALDSTTKVWEVASGREIFALPADHGMGWSVAWSPDGTQLAAGYQDGTIRVAEGIQHLPTIRVFRAHPSGVLGSNSVRSLAWSPNGDRLAFAGEGNLLAIWDPARGAELARIENPGRVLAVSWSPDGKRLASAASSSEANRLVLAWDAETGQRLSTMRGHNDNVVTVVWSPDGKRLASAGFDNTVRVWDPQTGQETFVLRGNAGMFYDVSWSPDGTQVAAASSEGQIWIWDATPAFERDTHQHPRGQRSTGSELR